MHVYVHGWVGATDVAGQTAQAERLHDKAPGQPEGAPAPLHLPHVVCGNELHNGYDGICRQGQHAGRCIACCRDMLADEDSGQRSPLLPPLALISSPHSPAT